MTTPPPGAPLQDPTGPYPQPSAWGPAPGYPPIPPPGPRPPARKKKRTGLILGLSGIVGIVFIVVIALVAGILVLANRNKSQPTDSNDPTVTATYAGETSPWVGHLPDPCKDFSADQITMVGLDPKTQDTGPENHSYTVQRSCQYRSPQPDGIASNATETLTIMILYQTFSYAEVLNNPARDNFRPVELNGQSATFYHIKNDDLPTITRCDLSVGTVFGNANFVGLDGLSRRLDYQHLCRIVLEVAKSLQPHISVSQLPK